ncbi:hypothetical protein Tsubulata_027966 [Turnera subulata]|uniref:C3H1-type domain-containing protein n=1 Tax=Turnera subulata TaxID=218843 RepID=A0A9Q0FTG0_9ROSI|nr:hypothetical protein Tsubulata_027966 [Turnera subulata]
MDEEPTRIVFNRIKKLDPQNVTKIIGYLFIQGYGDQEMTRLAASPDMVFQQVILKARTGLQLPIKPASSPMSLSICSPLVSELDSQLTCSSPSQRRWPPAAFPVSCYYEEPRVPSKYVADSVPSGYQDSISELQYQTQVLSLEDQIESFNLGNTGFPGDYFYPDAALGSLSPRMGRGHLTLNEFPVKTCHYFRKGFCRHGSNCRYVHGQVTESFPEMFDTANEDRALSPGTLERLELEIVEILKSRKGNPVSIASLPMIYYEKYGKTLQAEGYLTESQRHGRTGYSLTNLLARLKNSIRLVDRPHGQHAIILAEDAPIYMERQVNGRSPIVSGSRQIYLTFPAESTFTEDDVSDYFCNFGRVDDVRIPCQQKRMFGFVTFEFAETVKMVLAKGNPHFVCGSRVLVKPYRERKLNERKYHDRMDSRMCYSPQYIDTDPDLHSMPRSYDTSKLLRKQDFAEQEVSLQLEMRQLTELRMAQRLMAGQSYFGYSTNGQRISEEDFGLSTVEHFSFLVDNDRAKHSDANETDWGRTNSFFFNTDGAKHSKANEIDQDSIQGLNLPESPFASSNN